MTPEFQGEARITESYLGGTGDTRILTQGLEILVCLESLGCQYSNAASPESRDSSMLTNRVSVAEIRVSAAGKPL